MRLRELTVVLVSGCLPLLAHAQEAGARPDPADPAQRQQMEQQARQLNQARMQARRTMEMTAGHPQMEKTAWLGVGVSQPPDSLRHQLKLPEGTGLVIDFLEPASPAAAAGLQQFDLLVKLDDQRLINPEQLAVLVRLQKPGDEVKLTIVREGREQAISAKLVEHEAPVLGSADPFSDWMAPHMQKYHQIYDPKKTLTVIDGLREITVVTDGGHKTLMVRKPAGGPIVFTAPVDTPEQRQSLPHDLEVVLKNLPPDGSDVVPSPPPSYEPQKSPAP